MEERYVKRVGRGGGGCTETVPWRDNSNRVVKIERGRGIRGKRVRERKMRVREESEVLHRIRHQR